MTRVNAARSMAWVLAGVTVAALLLSPGASQAQAPRGQNVVVTNTPLPVIVNNSSIPVTGTLGISPAANAVKIVEDPFQVFEMISFGDARCSGELLACFVPLGVVPTGKRLVVTNIAVSLRLDGTDVKVRDVELRVGGETLIQASIRLPFNPNQYPSFSNITSYVVNEQVRLYVEAGQQLMVIFGWMTGSLGPSQSILVTGYWVTI